MLGAWLYAERFGSHGEFHSGTEFEAKLIGSLLDSYALDNRRMYTYRVIIASLQDGIKRVLC